MTPPQAPKIDHGAARKWAEQIKSHPDLYALEVLLLAESYLDLAQSDTTQDGAGPTYKEILQVQPPPEPAPVATTERDELFELVLKLSRKSVSYPGRAVFIADPFPLARKIADAILALGYRKVRVVTREHTLLKLIGVLHPFLFGEFTGPGLKSEACATAVFEALSAAGLIHLSAEGKKEAGE